MLFTCLLKYFFYFIVEFFVKMKFFLVFIFCRYRYRYDSKSLYICGFMSSGHRRSFFFFDSWDKMRTCALISI